MITHVAVNGFKSLCEFQLDFNKGLNILIGPNGAGKSNICQALGLISSAAAGKFRNYLLSVGGVESAFTILCNNESQQKNQIFLLCRGETSGNWENKRFRLQYEYSFKIVFKEKLILEAENLRLYRFSKKKRFKTILRSSRESDGTLTIKIEDRKLIGPVASKDLIDKVRTLQFSTRELNFETSLPLLSSLFYFVHKVQEDLGYSNAWNIDPHLAKKPSDVLESSNMLSDGRRLSNAVHEIVSHNEEATENLNELLSRVIPRYHKLLPETHESTKSFAVLTKDKRKIPAKGLSDGTVKLLALLIGIYSHEQSAIIIEEPENYLHPWASQMLIEYFRDYFHDKVCVVTTHSETILNTVRPSEIIVVTEESGITSAGRISDDIKLEEAIQTSGFGCGYHYVSGSLGGTPK